MWQRPVFANIGDINLDNSPMTAETPKSSNTVWHHATVTCERREQLNGHQGAAVWFTGLSGSGKIKDFTGISSPHEAPERPSLILDTGSQSLDQCADQVVQLLRDRRIIPAGNEIRNRQQA